MSVARFTRAGAMVLRGDHDFGAQQPQW